MCGRLDLHGCGFQHSREAPSLSEVGGMRASLELPPNREVVFRVRVVRACEAVRELSWGPRACSGPLSCCSCSDSLRGPAGAPLGAPLGAPTTAHESPSRESMGAPTRPHESLP